MLVDMTLGDLVGVKESRTDHATGRSVVAFDDELVDVEGIIGAIRSAGYEAEEVGE
jgi:copper chaperone CopZ